MLPQLNDPIIAIATANGRAAIGVVRLSAKNLKELAEQLFYKPLQPRQAYYLPLNDENQNPIDHVLALYFSGPHSYTGEDVLEIQAHGGPVVLQLIVAHCLSVAKKIAERKGLRHLLNLRLARPGEFTERAFHHQKLDLAQAEAVADLIDASTEAAARSASQSLSGAFSKEIHVLLDGMIHLRMLVEATLDFPEEDIDFLEKSHAKGQLEKILQQLTRVLQKSQQGALLREGIRIVIAGQPNAGKSSLLNALAGRELAIVTPIAGTTRDVVTQTIQIEGVPLHILDTAGLREGDNQQVDVVESMGIERAWEQIAQADAILFLHDLTRLNDAQYLQEDEKILQKMQTKVAPHIAMIHVWNKSDVTINEEIAPQNHGLHMSAKTGTGLEALRQQILATVGWQASSGEGLFMARQRHLQALQEAQKHVSQAHGQLNHPSPALDLLAEELRLAQNCLSSITGEFTSDDLLGVIFSRFCIGK
ncbi:MAG: tRNA uridine-5-carboxymethylaminomethyl(34) synthesis GTPase MnmE [Limnohabitans sp.]|nr:tRNA uridine-5-carboxymethylaminomethyl(34) synthesis GTPase MnmE [Limnohabitans sp.]